jgi:hypothetical protein
MTPETDALRTAEISINNRMDALEEFCGEREMV